jgi:hypothetical protein
MSEFNENNLLEISAMLETATQNVEKVYNSGYAVGQEGGYNNGKKDGYDAFWDAYQENGKCKSYAHAFAGNGWNDVTFNPKYDIKVSYGYMMFRDCAVTGSLDDALAKSNVKLDLTQLYDAPYLFSQCSFSKIGVLDLSNLPSVNNIFTGSKNLETIEELILKDRCSINNPFSQCTALKNLKITGKIGENLDLHWSEGLTHDSIMNVIGCLVDYSGSGKTFTLTLGATNLAKLSDVEKGIATGKGWTLA